MILKAEIKLDATGSRELSGTGVEPKTGFPNMHIVSVKQRFRSGVITDPVKPTSVADNSLHLMDLLPPGPPGPQFMHSRFLMRVYSNENRD